STSANPRRSFAGTFIGGSPCPATRPGRSSPPASPFILENRSDSNFREDSSRPSLIRFVRRNENRPPEEENDDDSASQSHQRLCARSRRGSEVLPRQNGSGGSH